MNKNLLWFCNSQRRGEERRVEEEEDRDGESRRAARASLCDGVHVGVRGLHSHPRNHRRHHVRSLPRHRRVLPRHLPLRLPAGGTYILMLPPNNQSYIYMFALKSAEAASFVAWLRSQMMNTNSENASVINEFRFVEFDFFFLSFFLCFTNNSQRFFNRICTWDIFAML